VDGGNLLEELSDKDENVEVEGNHGGDDVSASPDAVERAKIAMASATKERMPTTIPGVTLVFGKPKPVTLVRTVVMRNKLFHRLKSVPRRRPKRTRNPDAMPIRLMMTCTVV
jgi:hypothetical protein